ncbi:hypothetical protein JW835_02650 [bacterium]|nr:hypothetical protein [bacterium]
MKIGFRILTTSLIILSMRGSARSEKFLFCYKFRPGEYLTYQTNRWDSVLIGSKNRFSASEIHVYLKETLEVRKASPEIHHAIAYHLDAVDITPDRLTSKIEDWNLFQHFRKQLTDTLIYMSTNGYPLWNTDHFHFNQLTLPLSEFPLELNEGWEFEFELPHDPLSSQSCQSVVFGHGMLYDFIKEDSRTFARFVVNTTQLFEGECTIFNGSSHNFINREGVIEATHLVYFDEDRGIITKIITEQVTKEKQYTQSDYLSFTIKTKSTTELVDWDMGKGLLQ